MHYSSCPLCGSSAISEVLQVKDQTVSGEFFPVWYCNDCTVRFTQEVPDEDAIGAYYQSSNYISHSDTKKGFVNWLYHRVRQFTLGNKRKLVARCTGMTKGSLLDVGCGTGAFIHTMQAAGWSVTGLEPDANARQKAIELYNIHPQEVSDLFTLPAESYNAITLWHVMEHVHRQHEYAAQLYQLLAPGGRLFIAVPNYTSADAAYYKENWAAYDVPRHLIHYSPRAMQQLMEKSGFKLETLRPMWFDSFYIAMLSEKYKNGKGNLLRAVWNGFRSNLGAVGNTGKCSSVIYIFTKHG